MISPIPPSPSPEPKPPSGRLLVADDEVYNRDVLRDVLQHHGFEVVETVDGTSTLEVMETETFDAILLDVMMPGVDGFEICRRLKSDARTMHIPILLVTALNERKDRLNGIEAGANDFINKPIDIQDVPLRVRNAVRSKKLYDEIQESFLKLKEMEQLRDSLTSMIVHDMRSPLLGISGNLELLGASVAERLNDREANCLKHALSETGILVEMVNSLLDVSKMEQSQLPLSVEPCPVYPLIQAAIAALGPRAEGIDVHIGITPESEPAYCDPEVMRRVFINLLANAVKFVPESNGILVITQRSAGPGQLRIVIADNGPGIPDEYHDRIFQKFGQVSSRNENKKFSTGLGLTFCKLAIEAHGGQIGINSAMGEGSQFWFDLPVAQVVENPPVEAVVTPPVEAVVTPPVEAVVTPPVEASPSPMEASPVVPPPTQVPPVFTPPVEASPVATPPIQAPPLVTPPMQDPSAVTPAGGNVSYAP